MRRFVTGEIETPGLDAAVGTIGSAAVSSVSTAVSSVSAVAGKSIEASIEMSDKIKWPEKPIGFTSVTRGVKI